MEPYPDLIDGLTDCMDADEAKGFRIDGRMSVENLMQLCEEIYAWASRLTGPKHLRMRGRGMYPKKNWSRDWGKI